MAQSGLVGNLAGLTQEGVAAWARQGGATRWHAYFYSR